MRRSPVFRKLCRGLRSQVRTLSEATPNQAPAKEVIIEEGVNWRRPMKFVAVIGTAVGGYMLLSEYGPDTTAMGVQWQLSTIANTPDKGKLPYCTSLSMMLASNRAAPYEFVKQNGARLAMAMATEDDPEMKEAGIALLHPACEHPRAGPLLVDQGGQEFLQELMRVSDPAQLNQHPHLRQTVVNGMMAVFFLSKHLSTKIPLIDAGVFNLCQGGWSMEDPEIRMAIANMLAAIMNQMPEDRLQQLTKVQRGMILDSLSLLGDNFLRQGNTHEALTAFTDALRLNPNHPHIHFVVGQTLTQLGRFKQANAHMRRVVELQPDMMEAYFALSSNLTQHSPTKASYQEAVTQLEKALSNARVGKEPPQQFFFLLANCQEKLGRVADAVKTMGNCKRTLSRNTAAVGKASLEEGRLLLKLNQPRKALSALQYAVQMRHTDSTAHFHYAACLSKLGQHQEALRECDEVLRLNPTHHSVHVLRARCLMKSDRLQEAADAFGDLLVEHPDDAELHYEYSSLLIKLKRHRESLNAMGVALQSWRNKCDSLVERDPKACAQWFAQHPSQMRALTLYVPKVIASAKKSSDVNVASHAVQLEEAVRSICENVIGTGS